MAVAELEAQIGSAEGFEDEFDSDFNLEGVATVTDLAGDADVDADASAPDADTDAHADSGTATAATSTANAATPASGPVDAADEREESAEPEDAQDRVHPTSTDVSEPAETDASPDEGRSHLRLIANDSDPDEDLVEFEAEDAAAEREEDPDAPIAQVDDIFAKLRAGTDPDENDGVESDGVDTGADDASSGEGAEGSSQKAEKVLDLVQDTTAGGATEEESEAEISETEVLLTGRDDLVDSIEVVCSQENEAAAFGSREPAPGSC